jgi:hypothetical protein
LPLLIVSFGSVPGVVDAVSEEERVQLRRYKKDHSFPQLSGSNIYVILFIKNKIILLI